MFRGRLFVALIMLVGMMGFSSCAGIGDDSNPPPPTPDELPTPPPGLPEWYTSSILFTLEVTESEFVRHLLWDFEITDDEYAQTRTAFSDCVEGSAPDVDIQFVHAGGFTAELSGEYQRAFGDSEEAEAEVGEVIDACMVNTLTPIEPLYFGLRENPGGVPVADAIRECFAASDVEDGGELDDAALLAYVLGPEYAPPSPQARDCVTNPFDTLPAN